MTDVFCSQGSGGYTVFYKCNVLIKKYLFSFWFYLIYYPGFITLWNSLLIYNIKKLILIIPNLTEKYQ